MHNGIKKLFLTSLFMIFGLCFNSNYTYGVEITNSCVRYANSNYNCYEVEPGESYTLKGYELTISNNLTFSSDSFENILLTKYTSSSNKNYTTSLFWNGTGLYHTMGNEGNNGTYIYKLTGLYVSDSNLYTGVINSLANQTPNIEPIGNVLETINGNTVSRIVYMIRADFQAYPYYCFIYDDLDYSFCVSNDTNNQGGSSDSVWNKYLEKKTGAEIYNTPSELVNYLTTTYGISESPITVGTSGPTPITWSCPTIQDLINAYPTNYNTGLCYSSSLIVSGGTLQNVTPKSIFELFPSIQEFGNYINLYNNYCTSANTTTACQTAFDGNQDKYTLIAKLPNETNRIGIYQYCHYQLNIENKNTSTCVISTGEMYATGVNDQIAEEIQNQNTSLIGLIEDSIQNIKEIPTFNTGYVFDELLDDGEERTDGIKLDIFKTFLLLRSKLTTIFYFRNSQPGIIPEFISTIIIIILLFKIFKK